MSFETALFPYFEQMRSKVFNQEIANVYGMASNCLPVSLAALPIVQQDHPSAEIHIGVAARVALAELQNWLPRAQKDFDGFMAGTRSIPTYHSWIELTINNIDTRLDLTFSETNPGFSEMWISDKLTTEKGINYLTIYKGSAIAQQFLDVVRKTP
ncbi:hypothetical protein [Paraburkholderia bannensis]|uniref:hypothetical protein n=1 Tax=Paraburkholderia bannensis TaxID=765414 RepID=UPI0004861C09|nr:hypothetical protein [Paraburkholderia bannensis]